MLSFQDEFLSLLKLPSPASPDGAPHAPISLLASHVGAFLSQLEGAAPAGTAPSRSGANSAAVWRARAEGLLQRSGELRRQLLQIKQDAAAWTAAAVSARPQEAELERCLKEVDDKLLEMKAAAASLATAASESRTAPAYLEADVTSLAAAACSAHAACLLDRAFGGSSLPLHRARIMDALRVVRDHHVNEVPRLLGGQLHNPKPLIFYLLQVSRLLEGAFDIRVGAGDAQQQLKFEGLAAGMFEKQGIVNCVQVRDSHCSSYGGGNGGGDNILAKAARFPHLLAGAIDRLRSACHPHAT